MSAELVSMESWAAQREAAAAEGRRQGMQRAAIYARLSRNPDGSLDGVDRQIETCKRLAEARGYRVAEVYYDDNLSAWRSKARKARAAWDRMWDAVDRGEHDGIISYHSDRLARNDEDGGRLLRAGENDGLALATASGDYDLSTADGRFMFRVVLAASIKSSDDTSRRIKNKHQFNREQGKLSGRAAFGFTHNPDDPKGPRVVDPAEAEVIREVARRVLDGESWKSIVEDLNERGVRTHTNGRVVGRPFTRTTLRAALLAPRMAGWVTHNGQLVARIPGEPILDQETWERVCSELNGRKHGAPSQNRFLLSGLLTCGRCGRHLNSTEVRTQGGRYRYRVYKCRGDDADGSGFGRAKCSLSIMAAPAEDAVRALVLRWQANPKRLEQVSRAHAVVDAKVAKLTNELDRLRTMSQRNYEKLQSGVWDDAQYQRNDAPLDERIKAVRAELEAFKKPSVLRDVAVETVTKDYDAATDEEKRAMIRLALKSITVMPTPEGVKVGGRNTGYDPRTRVEAEPR